MQMRLLIGLFLVHLTFNFVIAWEYKSPNFTPNWLKTNYRSEIALSKSKLKKDPSNTILLTRLGYLYTLRNQLKHASRYINLAAKKGANDPFFFLSKGLLHSTLKEDEAARKYLFKSLLRSNQEYPEYFFYFAQHLFAYGEHVESIHWLQLGLKLHPSQPQLLTLLAWNFLSVSNWDRAEITLIKARQKNPQFDSFISFNLSKMYAKIGNWDSCIYNLRRAVLKGYRNHHKILLDSAFLPLKDHPQFILLVQQTQRNEAKFLNHNRFKKI